MNNKGGEHSVRALHDCFLAFNQVQHIDTAPSVVRDRSCEPVPPGFNELEFMQARAFFAPAGSLPKSLDTIHQVAPGPIGVPLPLYVREAMIQVNRTRLAVKAQPTPVPHLKGEDVRGGADLKHHRLGAAAVDSARRNEKVIMFLCRPPVCIALRREGRTALLRRGQVALHRCAIYALV